MTALIRSSVIFFFFNDTATTEIYTLSLHDALPIWDLKAQIVFFAGTLLIRRRHGDFQIRDHFVDDGGFRHAQLFQQFDRSEEHTSELQSLAYLVCRLLLEKKKKLAHTQRCTVQCCP